MAPDYWQVATQDLSRADPVMAALVEKYAGLSLVSRGDPFSTLARSIVGQQISVKAADAVWGRFVAAVGAVGAVEPGSVIRLGEQGLTGCGLSQRKIEYVCDLARHFSTGQLNAAEWGSLDDETLIQELCAVRGIGLWTAEMFLIFNQMRPDIFPVDDLGVQRAVREHYFAGEKQSPRQLAEFARRWQPWRTVATWYLWRSLDPVPVEY